jgi:hypothetical protein
MARQLALPRASMLLRGLMLIAVLALAACATTNNRAGQEGYVDHNNDGRFNPG